MLLVNHLGLLFLESVGVVLSRSVFHGSAWVGKKVAIFRQTLKIFDRIPRVSCKFTTEEIMGAPNSNCDFNFLSKILSNTDQSNHRLNGSSSHMLTATSLSYGKAKNLTLIESKPLI